MGDSMKSLLVVAGFLLTLGAAYAGETIVPKTVAPIIEEDVTPFVDEACAESFSCREKIIWELVMIPSGDVVSFGDMTQPECEEMKALVEAQTELEAFTGLKCRPRLVEREEI